MSEEKDNFDKIKPRKMLDLVDPKDLPPDKILFTEEAVDEIVNFIYSSMDRRARRSQLINSFFSSVMGLVVGLMLLWGTNNFFLSVILTGVVVTFWQYTMNHTSKMFRNFLVKRKLDRVRQKIQETVKGSSKDDNSSDNSSSNDPEGT
jgi:predicted PurR-regulated permease PerM